MEAVALRKIIMPAAKSYRAGAVAPSVYDHSTPGPVAVGWSLWNTSTTPCHPLLLKHSLATHLVRTGDPRGLPAALRRDGQNAHVKPKNRWSGSATPG